MVYNGPSTLSSSILLNPTGKSFDFPTYPVSPHIQDVSINFSDKMTAECVGLFFRWHYPHCLIIDRDQYLIEYSRHSSSALQYSICALGALMSSDMKIRCLADRYAVAAIKKLEVSDLWFPCESSIQALLLCSYYWMGNGNFSKAWMLSGMMFPCLNTAAFD